MKPLTSIERKFFPNCKSQLFQDFFVLNELGFKRNGYFVEFGANDGIRDSNTYMLEKDFEWNGILAEPSHVNHPALFKNRPNVKIDTNCVWKESEKQIDFLECHGEGHVVSTIEKFRNQDGAGNRRKYGNIYSVDTISLTDLLIKHQAPQIIDYLSIDTEGSEYEILSNFDWDKYTFKIITVEHNYVVEMRNQIHELLYSHGYEKKYVEMSYIDDWYVKSIP
jgi:FkbM family methyltransferase